MPEVSCSDETVASEPMIDPSNPAAARPAMTLFCHAGPLLGRHLEITPLPICLGRELAEREVWPPLQGLADWHLEIWLEEGAMHFRTLEGAPPEIQDRAVEEGTLREGEVFRFLGCSFVLLPSLPRPHNEPPPIDAGEAPPPPNAPADDDDSDFIPDEATVADLAHGLGKHITDAMDLERIHGFNADDMFSDVLRERSDEELEMYFNVGTAATTPALRDVNTDWPKPWAFARTLLLALLCYAGFFGALAYFANLNLVPGLIMVGSFAVPFSILVFFFEMNVVRNVSLYQLIKLVLIGGVSSLALSLIGFEFTRLNERLGPSAAGIIEEVGKAAVLLIMIGLPRYPWILNGLLFGAAVGTGFAVFESAGYALRFGLDDLAIKKYIVDPGTGLELRFDAPNFGPMLEVIHIRGILSVLGGHGMWTAIVGAALWKVRGKREFDFEMLGDPYFLKMLGFSVLVHMLWNFDFAEFLQLSTGIEFSWIQYIVYLSLGFVTWVVLLSTIQDGLKEVRHAQLEDEGLVR